MKCTSEVTSIIRGGHKEIKSLSLKSYSVDGYEKTLGEANFPKYKNF